MLHLGSLVRHGCGCSIRAYRSSPSKVAADGIVTMVAVVMIATAVALLAVFGLYSIYCCIGAGVLVVSGGFFLFNAFVVGLFLKSKVHRTFETLKTSGESGSALGGTEAPKIHSINPVLNAKTLSETNRYLKNRIQDGEYVFYQHQTSEEEEHLVMQKMDQGHFFCRTIALNKLALLLKEEFIEQLDDFIKPLGTVPLKQVSPAQLCQRRLGTYRPKLNHIQVGILGEDKGDILPFIRRTGEEKTEEEALIKEAVLNTMFTFFILEKPSSQKKGFLSYRLVIYANLDGKKLTAAALKLGCALKSEVALGKIPQLILDPDKMPPLAWGKKVDAEVLLQTQSSS